MVRQITTEEFTPERIEPIVRFVEQRAKWARPFSPDYFFPEWRRLMEAKIAVTWLGADCVLGAIFVPLIFTGEPAAMVSFWWSRESMLPTNDPIRLIKAFEKEAAARNCRSCHSSAYGEIRSEAMERLYRRLGYAPSETTFRKLI